MDRERHIQQQVEATLRALDDLPRLEANPFLFTRLQTRLTSEPSAAKNRLSARRLKPVVFTLLVFFNIMTAVHFLITDDRTSVREELIDSLRSDYSVTQNDF